MATRAIKPVVAWSMRRSALPRTLMAAIVCVAAITRSEASGQTPPAQTEAGSKAGDDAHLDVLSNIEFPSAQQCAVCHPDHYREWSVSPHAYAQISPTFNAYQATLFRLTNGTLGDFCERCHTQTGMSMGEPVVARNDERAEVSREGISCVVCHRVAGAYGKVTGRLPLESGRLENGVFGPRPDDELQRVLSSPDEFPGFSAESDGSGRRIHREARVLEQISHPGFCGRCHDVRMVDGFRLEDAFSEYKQTLAAELGETCQDCHMGPIPGVASAYPLAPAAIVGGRRTRPARRTNHMFVGPDDPLVHPGIFPHDAEAMELATPDEWSSFEHEAGWGTDEFESAAPDASLFPEVWAVVDDRYYAREIVERQLELRLEAHERATTLLRNGYGLGEVRVVRQGSELEFEVEVQNLTYGHSVPTGLIAERNVFLQVTVTDAEGSVVFRSGDLDPNGDVRDQHSLYVHAGSLPRDEQLFNLRSPFLVRNLMGGEREQVLPANYSIDPLIFVRPSPTSSLLSGGVRGVRLHKRNIPSQGHRWARYRIEAKNLSGNGPYNANIKLVVGQLPPHLIHAIAASGFPYGLTAREVADRIVRGYRVLWERDVPLGAEQ